MPTIIKEMINKEYSADITQLEDGSRSVLACITMSKPDRVKEVVVAEGGVFTDFMANPVVMMAHDYTKLPVGIVTELKKKANCIYAKVKFAERPSNHVGEWIPDTIFSLYQMGYLKGFSIGFIPIKKRQATKGDIQLYGEDTQVVTDRWELVELSVAPVPMLAQALSLAVSKGMITSLKVKEEKPEEEDEDKKAVVDPILEEDEDKKADDKPEEEEEHEKLVADDKPEAQPDDKPEAVEEEKPVVPVLEEDKPEEEEEEEEEVKLIQVKKEYMYLIPKEAKKLDLKLLVEKEIAKQRGKMYLD